MDLAAERSRLDKEIAKVEKETARSQAKLANEKFVANAKPEVVQTERLRLADWQEKLAQLQKMRATLGE